MNLTANDALLAILNSSWMVAAAAFTAWLTMKFLPRVNAATRYAVWWAVLAIVLVLPAALLWQSRQVDAPAIASNPLPVPTEIEPPVAHVDASSASVTASASRPIFPLQLRLGSWTTWVIALWFAIFLFHAAQVVWSYRYLRGVKQRARKPARDQRLNFDEWVMTCHIKRPVRLLFSGEISSPMAVGFLNPAVILPESLVDQLESDDLDHILLHELAHIARYDDWTKLAAHLAAATLVLHPVAAWILRRIEREREMACDDWVVAETGVARPYAQSLGRMVELCFARRRDLIAAGLAGRRSQLRERIERLVHITSTSDVTPRASTGRVATCAAALLIMVAAGARAPQWVAFAQDPPAAPVAPAPSATPAVAEPVVVPAPVVAPAPAPRRVAQAAAPASPAASAAANPPANKEPKESLLAALVANGYTGLSVDEIIELKNMGIDGNFITRINRAGFGKVTPKEMIELRTHGATPEYVQSMKEAFKDLTLKQVRDMRMYGVTPEYVRSLTEAGASGITADDLIQARMYGVSAANVREAKKYGSSMTFKQIIKLKNAGVL